MQVTKRNRKRAIAEINVVPYIDVMLVLLLIFMITAPLLTEGVQVNLPQAQAKTLNKEQKEPIVVSVDAQGKYYLNISDHPEETMSANDIATRVAAELTLAKQSGEKRSVMVKGDQSVDYGKVVQAMVMLQAAGAETVGLVTAPGESPDQKAAEEQPSSSQFIASPGGN
jgi:biopolymer transport protein TolR